MTHLFRTPRSKRDTAESSGEDEDEGDYIYDEDDDEIE